MSLTLTNKVFLFGEEEITSVSLNSCNPVMFYFIGAILSGIFYKTDNFNVTKHHFSMFNIFFLCFSLFLSINKKKSGIKCCPNNRFFSTELIKIRSDINTAEMLMSFRYFALNTLRIKSKKCLKFYHLLLLSGDISLNPGPSQYLTDNDNKFEPFRKRSSHFFHINVNSLLSKIYELRDIAGHAKPAISGITESKLDSSF